jgi:GR25 family glycosyltransferase involved in LPS biosynthesis
MKIGITIGLKDNKESIWTNGIKLNVLNLVRLLKKSDKKYDVCILNTVNVNWDTKPNYLNNIDIYNFDEKFMEMDLIFVMGAQVSDDDLKKFKSQGNKKVVSYKCGNNYVLHMEETLFKEGVNSQYETSFDEVWYIPQQHENNNGYYHTLYRTNSIIVPFLWDSKDLDESLESVDLSFKSGKFKKSSKYEPKEKKTLGIMEPNLNIVKYSLIPTMIAEESYRTEIGKSKIEKLMLTNSSELGKHKSFLSIIKTFDLFKDKKISAESRYQTAFIVSQHLDVLISHQLMNPLNYLYLDVAYMGYPVLHNAYMCKDLGYYYEGSSTVEGSKMLNWILENHDNNLENYREKNKKVFDRYSINNPDLVRTYDKLIENLFRGKGNEGLSYDVMKNLYTNLDLTETKPIKKNVDKVNIDDIVFYVISSNQDRLDFMKRQFIELDLHSNVVFFNAYTPKDSSDWVVKNDKYSPDKLQSCLRSHISAIKEFTENYPNKRYICVLEDDVSLLKENFKKKLLEHLDNFNKNNDVEYLTIGYLPTTTSNAEYQKKYNFKSSFLDNEKLSLITNRDGIYYGFYNKGFAIWGAQAQIFPMDTAKKIVHHLHKESAQEIYDSIKQFSEKNQLKQNKMVYLTPDSIFPVMFEQGIVNPPLAIENDFGSLIHISNVSVHRLNYRKQYEEMGYIKLSNYYS